MARYIVRTCPKCRGVFGVAITQTAATLSELSIKGICAFCGYRLRGWRLFLGGKRAPEMPDGRMPKVFR